MVKTGTLHIDGNTDISHLDSGTSNIRLARQSDGDPLGAATDFLVNERQLNDDDFIWVTGSNGPTSGGPAFFITDAGLASEGVAVLTATEAISVRAIKAAVKIGLRAAVEAADSSNKSSGKGAPQKGSAKKGGAKKAGAKKSGAKKGAGKKANG
jgi:hypothetical protein